jgi:glycosyltransferase involved in cell wall biosynthesis
MCHLYRRSNAVVTYGRHVSRYVIGEGACPERVLVAPQAVRSLVLTRPDADRWRRPLQLLYVGRLETWKGPHLLLQALARLGSDVEWRLHVAGRGSQAQELAAEARHLGIDRRVSFLGHVPHDSLGSLYASSAAVVVPSIRTASFSEPWALVVNEAMQAGALVVASDCVGAVQDGLVRDGETGLVFRAGDVSSLAHRLAVVADAANTPLLRGIAEAGCDVISGYSFSTAARAFVAAANMVRDSHRRRSP